MSSTLPAFLSAVIQDALSARNVPGGSVLGFTIQALFQKRIDRAREILIEELKRGDKSIHEIGELEEAAAVIYRYGRAAQEGTARLNLRLMAKVIAGQAQLGNLVADEFLHYADILAPLRREELVIIATMHRIRKEIDAKPGQRHLYGHTIWERLTSELVPSLVHSPEELRAWVTSAMRSGLIISLTGIDDVEFFATSPLMDRLEKLASFEDALRQEPPTTRPNYAKS
jgi:hypothetical protein